MVENPFHIKSNATTNIPLPKMTNTSIAPISSNPFESMSPEDSTNPFVVLNDNRPGELDEQTCKMNSTIIGSIIGGGPTVEVRRETINGNF